jgi:predicted  nucleic acid-binding Zn-ribbon protein
MMTGLLTTLLCSAFQAHAVLLSAGQRAKVHADVTPVEKVINMVEELQAKVSMEGKMEAETYSAFGCFCKSKTDEKTKAISEEEQTVSDLASEIKKLSSKRDTLDQEIQDLTEEIAEHEHFLATAEEERKKERAIFEASDLDLEKSVHQIDTAVNKLKSSEAFVQGKGAAAAFAGVQASVQTALDMADSLGLIVDAKLPALLQQPVTEVPVADYTFHAGSIIATLEELLKAFRDKKVELETAEAKAQSDFERAMQSKAALLKSAQEDVDAKNKKRTMTTEEIATAQADMTSTNAVLNDDRTYLKDLTAKCELKAKQWDQRSSMRADELTAITQALTVLKGSVASQAEKVGEGGRFLQEEEDDDDVSFVQTAVVSKATLRLVKKAAHAPESSTDLKIRSKLAAMFRDVAAKTKSPMLSTLALKVGEDPFVKIKGMIQDMIEKLLQEEADEANHKGYCDEEISKTVKDRDYRLQEIEELHASLEELNAREEKLALTKGELEEAVKTLSGDYTNQTAARAAEKAENEETVDEAKDGVHAIKQALEILSHFYGEAAQATVEEGFIQKKQPSVEDDAPDAGFDGAYTGAQGSSTGIVGMMEVILGDFERTISDTEELEASQKKEFIDYERETQVSISVKQAALTATSDELTETQESIANDLKEMRTQQGLFDTKTREWEELLPGCVADPGMSYAERVERREIEIQALKDAYCILDNKEAGCDGVF